eukprot:2526885-Rhodomonas_salina.3
MSIPDFAKQMRSTPVPDIAYRMQSEPISVPNVMERKLRTIAKTRGGATSETRRAANAAAHRGSGNTIRYVSTGHSVAGS